MKFPTLEELGISLKEKGWYAACQCWDPREGAFPSAIYFDGEKIIRCVQESLNGEIVEEDCFNYVFDTCYGEDVKKALEAAEIRTNW